MKVHCEVCGKKKDKTRALCISVDGYRRWVCRYCISKSDILFIQKPDPTDEILLTGYVEYEPRQEELDELR